jgi:hypothetical protein
VQTLAGTDHSLAGRQAEVVAALVAFATAPSGAGGGPSVNGGR